MFEYPGPPAMFTITLQTTKQDRSEQNNYERPTGP